MTSSTTLTQPLPVTPPPADCPTASAPKTVNLQPRIRGKPKLVLKPIISDLGTLIPGNLDRSKVPQMIILTFDDAISYDNWELYSKHIFTPNRRNPNGCPIRSTFFVSHQYNNYQETQKMWNDGHEIAVHSITYVKSGFGANKIK